MEVSKDFHFSGNFVAKSMSDMHNVFKECTLPRTFVKSEGI